MVVCSSQEATHVLACLLGYSVPATILAPGARYDRNAGSAETMNQHVNDLVSAVGPTALVVCVEPLRDLARLHRPLE